jgi:hypothetical protein
MPDRLEKATSYTASVNASGESDEQVVPAKRPNKGEQSSAEGVEGSRSTKGNTEEARTLRTQGRERVSQGLGGVREAARRDPKQKFTALLHHVTAGLLRLLLPEEGGGAWGGRSDVAAVWSGTGGTVDGPPRPSPSGRVSRPTVEEDVHTQSRWPATAIRDRRAGG